MTRSKKTDENFYRCYPRRALSGMIGLSLEERGVYRTLIDVMYQYWRPLPFHDLKEKQQVTMWCGAAPQKVNPIVRELISSGRLKIVRIDGRDYLTDDLFDTEAAEIRGGKKPSKSEQSQTEVGVKSDRSQYDVAEKSRLLEWQAEQNQTLDPPRIDKEENRKEENTTLPARATDFVDDWPQNDHVIEALCEAAEASVDLRKEAWVFSTVREVLAWKLNRFSFRDDVVPTIRARFTTASSVRSWAYFTQAIAQAHVARTREIPLPDVVPRGVNETFATRRANENAGIFSEIFDGKPAS